MPSVTAAFLRGDVTIPEGTTYPIFTGFLTPDQIGTIAEVPNYTGFEYNDDGTIDVEGDSHDTLASNLLNNPTDEWQRPLSSSRVGTIGDWYSAAAQKRLMANPVLLGESSHTTGAYASITATGAGADLFNIEFTANPNKPLLILDGQHRIFGLNSRPATRDNKIPVVLLIKDNNYTKHFLAQIFTEVTTGAKKLELIHEWWMKYTFSMDPFSTNNYRKAMEATIRLCTETQIDGTDNEFLNGIKFNPTDKSSPGPWNVTYSCIDWTKMIYEYYENCTLSPANQMDKIELARTIVRFTRAAKETDAVADDSKIFGGNVQRPHTILRDALFGQLISYCVSHSNVAKGRTKDEWIADILTPGQWTSSNWTLGWAAGAAGLSSVHAKPSKKSANWFFRRMFQNPTRNASPISTLIKCATHGVRIEGNKKTPGGSMSTAAGSKGMEGCSTGASVSINGGTIEWPDLPGNDTREMIRVHSDSDDCASTLWSVKYTDSGTYTGTSRITGGERSGVIDLSTLTSPLTLNIETIGYHSKSIATKTITVDW